MRMFALCLAGGVVGVLVALPIVYRVSKKSPAVNTFIFG